MDSCQFPVLSGRNRSEIIGKNPKNFRWEYCFHVPAISGAFLPESARNFRPGLFSEPYLIRPIFNIYFSSHALYENILEKSGFIEKSNNRDVELDAENYLITKSSLNNVCSVQLMCIDLLEVYFCRFEKNTGCDHRNQWGAVFDD